MKYSVVIPLYNKEHYIAGTLRSVLTQTFPDYEVIVVDDGSTDHSLQACKEVRSDKIRVVQQVNQGVSAARNKGIELAAGEYICFLDADDTWHPDYLQNIETIVQKYPQSDIFVTAYRIIYANGRCKESRRLPQANGCLPSYWETLGKGYDFVWTSATTVRRTALLAAGGFRLGEKIGQDLDLWARLARNNPCVAYASRVCATGYTCGLNHDEFWQWCRERVYDGHKVYISEYRAPEDFVKIWALSVTITRSMRLCSLPCSSTLST